MRNIKFLILAFGLLAAQWVLAVQLPSTSYNANESDVTMGGMYSYGTGVMFKGSFRSLGAYESCRASAGVDDCSDCCYSNYASGWISECAGSEDPAECVAAKNQACVDECKGDDDTPLGPGSPIEGGLWILLMLAIISGVSTVMFGRVKHISKRSE